MRAEVARISTRADLAGYDRFMERSAAICALGFERLGHVPFMSLAQMARHAPDLLRLGGASSVYGLVSRYVKDPRLRIALSFHPLFVGGNPFDTTAVYCLISHLERRWGVHFAMGGTGMLVRGLVGLIKGAGRRGALRRRCGPNCRRGRRGEGGAAPLGRDHRSRASSSRTPTPPTPIANWCRPRRAGDGRTRGSTKRNTR